MDYDTGEVLGVERGGIALSWRGAGVGAVEGRELGAAAGADELIYAGLIEL